jgi:hypothetical protein
MLSSCAASPQPPASAARTQAFGEAQAASGSTAGLESAGTWLLIGAGIGSGAGPIGAGAGALAGLVYGLSRREAVKREDAREAARQHELTAAQARELEARARAVPDDGERGSAPAADRAADDPAGTPSQAEIRRRELETEMEAELERQSRLRARLQAAESLASRRDVVRYYAGGAVVREERLDATGTPMEVVTYDAAGNVVRKEERRQGRPAVISHYEAGRLVRRELFDLAGVPVPRAPRVSPGRPASAVQPEASPPDANTTETGGKTR